MSQDLSIQSVTLRVRDLASVESFYRQTLGLVSERLDGRRARLSASAGSTPLLVLEEHTWAAPRRPGSAGLFHTAFLYPGRAQLGALLTNLGRLGVPFGAGDHGVSEALYLYDPENNGIELYADRPRSVWPTGPGGALRMGTETVDLASLEKAGRRTDLAEAEAQATIGHIHLNVTDLERARALYSDRLGFPVRQSDIPGALFLGRDGYHHHVGLNVWHSRKPASARETGLSSFVFQLDSSPPGSADEPAHSASGLELRDPDGWEIFVRTCGGHGRN